MAPSSWTYDDRDGLVRREAGDTFDAITEAIYALIAERQASFSIVKALRLVPVVRGVNLIASVAASLLPLVYRDGVPLADQPRIVRKPDPFRSRYAFVYQSVRSLVEVGDVLWRLLDHDGAWPRAAMVLPWSECRVEWDARRVRPRYWWRGQELIPDVDVKHVALDIPPGELRGRGPLSEALDQLYPIQAAEDYAAAFFGSGGIPTTVLQSATKLSAAEAATLKAQWMTNRSGPEPAVLSGGVTADYPTADPEKAQLQAARAYGATVVARLLGIPGPLLHVETSGATIVYQNAESALEELTKVTVAPLYLAPLEQAWSELVPGPQSVRFDLAELQRASLASRLSMYAAAIGAVDPSGVPLMTSAEARGYEGWPAAPSTGSGLDTSHAFDPVPDDAPTSPAVLEVPAGA